MYQSTIYKNFQIVFAFYRYTNVITCESFRSQASLVQNLKEYERHNTFLSSGLATHPLRKDLATVFLLSFKHFEIAGYDYVLYTRNRRQVAQVQCIRTY